MFSQLFQTVPDALIVVDDRGIIVMANQHAERLFGYEPGAMASIELEVLMPRSARDRHRVHRAGYMDNPRTRPMGASNMALTGQRLDGQQFPIEIALSPLDNEQGPRFLASVRDISETQRARQGVIRARYDALVARIGQLALETVNEEAVIAELPAMLAEALSVQQVAVAILAPDRKTIHVLASVGSELTGSTATEPAHLLRQALEDGTPILVDDLSSSYGVGHGWPGPAGHKGSLAVMPLLGRDRAIGALIARSTEPRRFDHDAQHLLRSVANLLAALLQRRLTEEQLAHSQRLEAIGQLTGGIAHDFNNLLTVVSGNLQLLEFEYSDRPGALDLIGSALRSVNRGAELTSKLLAFARRQRLQPLAVEPEPLLRDLEVMLRGALGDKIRLRVECEPRIPAVFADATQLDAALVNLALNARDAMPDGGDIQLRASERWVSVGEAGPELAAGHYVVFGVSDSGAGMPPEILARAVEPFFSTKPLGHGTGLGLSMVYGFVRQSDGYILINSRIGAGTTVEMFLPVAPDSFIAPVPVALPATDATGKRVLVVEDDPDVRTLAAAIVASLGYGVSAVASAADALELLRGDATFALLFSDVMLGEGMNGKELARAARKLRPGLAVLLASGYEDTPEDSAAGEVFELLRKPYRREQLSDGLRRQLRQKP